MAAVSCVGPGRAVAGPDDRGASPPAAMIFKAGRIWTGDPARPWAEAVAVRDGAIVAVGDAAEVERSRGPATRVVDHPGGFAMPGLIDAHTHLEDLGAGLEEVDLRGVASLDEVARRVATRADERPGDGWIIGSSFDQSLWPGGEFAGRAVLDKVAPARPVWLRRVDGHAGWANSEAIRRAGVTRATQALPDGQILRDASGEPSGVFVDGAMALIRRAIPPASKAEIERHILAGQAIVVRSGIAGIHDAGVSAAEREAFLRLDREGRLKLRVYAMASPPAGGEAAFVGRPVPAEWQGRLVRVRSIKLFMDGAMGSRGGLLFEPYSDDPGNRGLQLIDARTLEATATAALRNGWQVNTHAIGDRANAMVLDAYAAARAAVPEARDPRLRVEHAQVVRRPDVARFKSLGVIASMQPSHASDDLRWADARLGPGRVDGAYAWRWFLDAGVPVAFGSDFPVEVVSPFYGIYAALTRSDEAGMPPGGWHPDQVLTVEEALRGFTAGSAFAAFDEGRVGVLKVGMRADLTVIDRDPFRVRPIEVLRSKVLATVVDGEVVYEAR